MLGGVVREVCGFGVALGWFFEQRPLGGFGVVCLYYLAFLLFD